MSVLGPASSASAASETSLGEGDLPPHVLVEPPGPASRAIARRLATTEAPGINTLGAGDEASIVWRAARGANVLDVDGNRYVDLTSGFGAALVGHRHPRVVAALARQAEQLVHGLGDAMAHELRVALAERLAALAPVDAPRVYFAVSGADAVEVAIKSALLATGRGRIVAFAPAYHGLTLGALAVTSRAAFRAPFAAHLHAQVERLPFAAPLADVERALARDPAPAALLVEPIVGREGVLVPPAGWLSGVAARCRRYRVPWIADEILTGFGRTGTLFAVDAEALRPDLLCCGKALGGGLPIAAVVGRAELLEAWRAPGEARHTGTFVAHPLACAAALATLELIAEEDLPARARRLGERLAAALATSLPAGFELRGRGALWGLEPLSADAAKRLLAGLARAGYLALGGGPDGRLVELLPPLAITDGQLDGALATLGRQIAELP